MTECTIGSFVGSLARNSIDRTLSKALLAVAPDELTFTEIPIGDVPLYWGTNSFDRKPTGIIGASPGGIGTAVMHSSPIHAAVPTEERE